MSRSLYCFIFILFLTSSCGRDDPSTQFSGEAMTMQYRIVIADAIDRELESKIEAIIRNTFGDIDEVHNKWNPDSELSRFNKLPANQSMKVSPMLNDVLTLARTINTLSEGRFDPTIEPLQQLWKEKLANGTTPSSEKLSKIAHHIGWNHLSIDNDSLSKDSDGMQLDLGGIAKGYCIDLLTKRLQEAGIRNLYVEWGGEIAAAGHNPKGNSWTVFISKLGDTNEDEAIAIVPLDNKAIATSGDYLQNWTVLTHPTDKKKTTYFHILDPHSLQPLIANYKSIASASVVANSCALADALATAAMMFSTIDEAEKWLETMRTHYPEIKFWLASREFLDQRQNRLQQELRSAEQ